MKDPVREEALSLLKRMPIPMGLLLLAALPFGWLDWQLVGSVLLGSGYAMAHFLLIGGSVRRALAGSPRQAQFTMVAGYFTRLLLTGLLLVAGSRSGWIRMPGLVLPLFFPKLILYARAVREQWLRPRSPHPPARRKPDKKGGNNG